VTEEKCLLTREGIDSLRNKSFMDLCTEDGAIAVESEHALMCLAACLGLIQPGCDNWKDVIYCRDPITNMLCDILKRMVEAGLLKYDGEKDGYLPIDLKKARMVEPSEKHGPEYAQRGYDLRDQKLLWEEDLHQAKDGLVYIESGPVPGMRSAFDVSLYWCGVYPSKG
jgi:hypothetical protein